MIAISFIIGMGLVNLILCIMLLYKGYKNYFRLSIFLLTLAIFSSSFISYFTFQHPFHNNTIFLIKLYTLCSLITTYFLIEISVSFQKKETFYSQKKQPLHIYLISTFWRPMIVCTAVFCFLVSWIYPSWHQGQYVFIVNTLGLSILCIHFLLTVVVLYYLENVYRFAAQYQRRLGRLAFLSLLVMVLAQLIFLTRGILYKTISHNYVDITTVVNNICLVVVLVSLIKYRLWSEKIVISRQSVYSSITLFLIGAVLLGLSLVTFFMNYFGFSFTHFELFLIIFIIVFFLTMSLSSADMRIRITKFINTRFYKSKYDYREQFFNLYSTYVSSDDLYRSINNIINNLKNAAIVDEAQVFLLNSEDGNYYVYDNPYQTVPQNFSITGDSLIVKVLNDDSLPLYFSNSRSDPRIKRVLDSEGELIEKLDLVAVIPIIHNSALLGLLTVKRNLKKRFDREDKNLIQVFAASIGIIYYRHRLLQKNIEQKQFESFHHIASFIIHDIKNQVATLSLLTKNSEKNIANPDFQKSLFRSLQNCSESLQSLVNKLSSPPQQEEIESKLTNINPIVRQVIDTSGILNKDELAVSFDLQADHEIKVNEVCLQYIIINLITNALESMNYSGTLQLITGNVDENQQKLIEKFALSETFLGNKMIFFNITDNGSGMTEYFLKYKLFRPFSSTKDKGVGIGLYQCKILVEKMNGKLLCHSVQNHGTTFCMLF